jgi:predicted HicB family RNase H-like nuclease
LAKDKKNRGVGRPELPKGHAMGKIVPVRFKPDEFKAISKAAKASKQSVSEWVRSTLNAKLAEPKAA